MTPDVPPSVTPRVKTSRSRLVRVALCFAVWLVTSLVAFVVLFSNSSAEATLLSHQATLRPSLSLGTTGEVTLHTGPLLPDVRIPSNAPISVDVTLGKTTTDSLEQLVARYAFLASAADGERSKLTSVVASMAIAAGIRAAVLGAFPLLLWGVVGAARRRELITYCPTPRGAIAVTAAAVLTVGLWQPWSGGDSEQDNGWTALPAYLPEVKVPAELRTVAISGDASGNEAKRLIASMLSTYSKSKTFYDTASGVAAGMGGQLRQPAEGDTVVLVVTDRHDNIGMDAVARAIGDAGGATAVYDLGDDTSTGSPWEEFSLDSVTAAFKDLDRWLVTGNHDQGSFVGTTMAKKGWSVLDGQIVTGPGGAVILGENDPRSSGLGDWRDQKGKSISEVSSTLADVACASSERVSTLLVHDANAGKQALARGCVDLVLAGHTHLFEGPTAVTGTNGATGWSFTTGTTGGAAYAIAIGSKPRREAGMSLITYREGRPIGLQAVRLATNGSFKIDDWVPLKVTPSVGAGAEKDEPAKQGK